MKHSLFVIFLCLLLTLPSCIAEEQPLPLRVHVLDVGQGSCVLIRTQAGDILVDSGTDASQTSVCMRLADLGVTHLSLLILTSTGNEHLGGADGILDQIPTDLVWMTRTDAKGEAANRLQATCLKQNVSIKAVRAGERFSLGEVTFFVLAPLTKSTRQGDDMALRVECGDCSILLAGDLDSKAKRALLSQYGKHTLACDVCIAPSHGAFDDAMGAFLESVHPSQAIISCGEGNADGLPHGGTLLSLRQMESTVWRTDLLGELIFRCDGKNFVFEYK